MRNNIYLGLVSLLLMTSCFTATKNDSANPNAPTVPRVNPGEAGDDDLLSSKAREVLFSQAYREVGSQQYTLNKLNELLAKNEKPAKIHFIPDPSTDIYDSVTSYNKAPINCGYGDDIESINERINDCKAKNGENYQWLGSVNGNSGEGTWTLVYVSGVTRVWLDENTGLVWSPPISETNWNNASGSSVADTDYRCSTTKLPMFTSQEITWRLPTRNELLQADLNGSRSVISHLNAKYWSASASVQTDKAWAIEFNTGSLELADKSDNTNYKTICIGEVLK